MRGELETEITNGEDNLPPLPLSAIPSLAHFPLFQSQNEISLNHFE